MVQLYPAGILSLAFRSDQSCVSSHNAASAWQELISSVSQKKFHELHRLDLNLVTYLFITTIGVRTPIPSIRLACIHSILRLTRGPSTKVIHSERCKKGAFGWMLRLLIRLSEQFRYPSPTASVNLYYQFSNKPCWRSGSASHL